MSQTKAPEWKTFVSFRTVDGRCLSPLEVPSRDHEALLYPEHVIAFSFYDVLLGTLPDPRTGEPVEVAGRLVNQSQLFIRRGRIVEQPLMESGHIMFLFGPLGMAHTHEVVAECPDCGAQARTPCFAHELNRYVILDEIVDVDGDLDPAS